MLYFPNCRYSNSIEYPVANGAYVTQEGAPLSWSVSGQGVQPSLGTSADRFAGVSLNQQYSPVTLPYVDSLTVPLSSTYTVVTTNTPVSGTIYVLDTTTNVVQTAGNPATTANTYSYTGSTFTFNVAQAGATMSIFYQYSPTTQQVLGIQGMNPAGTPIASYLGSTGVILEGIIFTSAFDTSVNWGQTGTAPSSINLGAGIFTVGGSGPAITGYVQSVPSVTQPFLGLYFRA